MFKRKTQPIVTGTANNTFFPLDFVKQFISGSLSANEQKYIEYYLSVPELQSIINYRARSLSSMNLQVRRRNTDEVIDNHPILDLLRNPNPLQSFREFVRQYSINKDIFGNAFHHLVYGTTPDRSQAIYNLPSLNAEVKRPNNNIILFNSTDQNEIIEKYRFYFMGKNLYYDPDEILHFADNLTWQERDDSYILKGASKIQSISQACENIKTAYEVRGMLIGNSPMGVLSNQTKDGAGTIPMTPDEEEELQKRLKKYGLTKEKYQYIVTSQSLSFVSMAQNIGNLKLFEEVDNDQSAIADQYSFPVELFQNNVTYENKKEAKKQLYQDSIIPEAKEWLDGISSVMFPKLDYYLYPDYSHISVLQSDYESKARIWNYSVTALSKALADQAITLDEYTETLKKIELI